MKKPLLSIITSLLLLFFISNDISAQVLADLRAGTEVSNTFVSPPEGFVQGGERDVVISVTYNGFSPEAQAAFQYAVDIWASLLTSSVPILIDATYGPLGEGVLGSAGPEIMLNDFAGAPEADTYYPVALANKLAGFDLDPGWPDINANFNSDFDWYFGTDGNPAFNEFDFVSVVLHELGHGLGFVGSADVSGSTGSYNSFSPFIYDTFVETNTGMDILAYTNNSTSLGNALEGGNLFWFGGAAEEANGFVSPEIYAPSTWEPGSSFSHWDEEYFEEGNANSLMTPYLNFAEAIHDPGPVSMGMMEDMGWDINPTSGGCEITGVTFTQLPCQDNGGGLLPVFNMTFDISGGCFIDDVYWDDGTGYVFGNLPDAGIFVFDGDGFNLINTVPDAFYELYFVLDDGTISDIYTFQNGNCDGEIFGCTNEYATNYDPAATSDNGTCVYDETICDCLGTEHTIGVLIWVGDGFADAGGFDWDGQPVDFNCSDWGYDCGDIDGAPLDDPYGVCFGGLPPNNGCSGGGDCTFGPTVMTVNGCFEGTDVAEYTFNFDGDCIVSEICLESTFDTQLYCFDILDGEAGDGDNWYITGIPIGLWEFWYTLDNGETSPIGTLNITDCIPVLGCTNPYATNYNDGADEDDGTCLYNETICDCNGNEHTIGVLVWLGDGFGDIGGSDFLWDGQTVSFNCSDWGYDCSDIEGAPDLDPYGVCEGSLPPENGCGDTGCTGTEVTIEITTDCWGEEVAWTLTTDGGAYIDGVLANGYGDLITYTNTYCLDADCYEFEITDTYGDGMFGSQYIECDFDGYYIITDGEGTILAEMGDPDYGFGILETFCVDGGVEGCTDAAACNYNPAATINDGSCDYSCYGCTDSAACNYDAAATIDDGSCDYSCFGCTNVSACNYNPEATIDDGSCNFDCFGCTDAVACNYDPGATLDDGSCDYTCLGCTNFSACNYDPTATIDDGSCDFSCFGCTDPTACNYDPDATVENGSCSFTCYGCTDSGACNYNPDATIDNGSCDYSCLGCTDPTATNYDPTATIDDGSCIYGPIFGCTDDGACNYNEIATDDDGSCEYLTCAGCTDAGSCNYDETATIDDGSCEYTSCAGCTDDGACNFDETATIDDDSCEYETCAGCTDPESCNFDETATIDDGSCDYETCAGCTDSAAINYDANATLDDGSCIYDCEYPTINYDTYCEDGEEGGFYIEMDIDDLGNGAPYSVTNNQNSDEISLSFLGVINLGPFDNNESVLITIQSDALSGCFLTSPVLSDDCIVSIEEIQSFDFIVYPNPNSGSFNISTENFTGKAIVTCYDMTGRIVFDKTEMINSNQVIEINESSIMASGIYTIEISTNMGTIRKELIINK